jgi:16S rRNA (guanine527-N7)-methyltransferase
VRSELFDRRLDEAWAGARASGLITDPISDIREHAAGFVSAAWHLSPPVELVDIGSGAGIPGIHLAQQLAGTRVRLVDASARRCDMARAAVSAVELTARVTVTHARVEELAREEAWRGRADGVVSRLFGPAAEAAECALPLLAVGGRMVVSVNRATGDWWRSAPLTQLGAMLEESWETPAGAYVAIVRTEPAPDRYPRRPPARRRRPWPD